MNTYTLGSTVRLQTTFSSAGTNQNPTTVTFEVRDPQGNLTTPTPVADGAGAYHYDLTTALSGIYFWRATGTGFSAYPSAEIVAESSFSVSHSSVLNQ